MLEEAESGWFRHTGRSELSVRVRLARTPANRYSPKPSFQPFEIPLRPRAEAEESIFKFVMETSGCNYGKRPNFHRFFFFLFPVPEFPANILQSSFAIFRRVRDTSCGWMDANNFEFSAQKRKKGGAEGNGKRETVATIA